MFLIVLGGAATEEMFYGESSTGSRGDFEQALQYVATMIDSGLTQVGIIQKESLPQEMLVAETGAILGDLMEKARSILVANRSMMEQLLPEFLEKESFSCERLSEQLKPAS